MDSKTVRALVDLASGWTSHAVLLREKSNKTWEMLGSGELPQEDKNIYSVYEDQAASDALYSCASQLMITIKAFL